MPLLIYRYVRQNGSMYLS